MWAMVTEMLWDKKTPLAFAAIGMITAWTVHEWLDITFVTRAEAEVNVAGLTTKINANGKKIDANGVLIERLRDSIDLNTVRQEIKDNRNQQYSLRVQIEQSGETALSRQRKTELDNALSDLEKAERCMTNINCQ